MSNAKSNIGKIRVDDPQLQQWIDSVTQLLHTWNSDTNNALDVVVTYRDFVEDTGLSLALDQSDTGSGISTPTEDTSLPPALSLLSISQGMATNHLTWSGAGSGNYGHTRIYRHTSDVVASATIIDTTVAGAFTDSTGDTGVTYYYWVRPVSEAGVVGAFNATAGTAGVNNKVAVANLNADVPLSTTYVSAEQTISSAGLLTLAHGLASAPFNTSFKLVCQTTEHNYAVTDEILISPDRDIAIVSDATNLNIRFNSGANPMTGYDYTTGVAVTFTNANWKLVAYAWV